MRDKSGIVFAIVYNMKYVAVIVPAVMLAIKWNEGAGFLVLCIASLIILKMWENHEQSNREDQR